jgi:hypothetical protein
MNWCLECQPKQSIGCNFDFPECCKLAPIIKAMIAGEWECSSCAKWQAAQPNGMSARCDVMGYVDDEFACRAWTRREER